MFDLVGHPKATRVYASSYATEGTTRNFVAVLGVTPVVASVRRTAFGARGAASRLDGVTAFSRACRL